MMSTCIGAIALALSILYSKGVWVGRALDFFPLAFLLALFMSLGACAIRYCFKSPYVTMVETKVRFFKSLPVAFWGVLCCFLPDFPSQAWRAGILFLSFFVWIDVLLADFRSLRSISSFERVAEAIQKRFSRAIKTKNMHTLLSEFESVMLVCEKVFSESASQETQKSAKLVMDSVERILSSLPQMNLPVGDKSIESLFDRYFLFQAVVAKKLETLVSLVQKNPSDVKWDLLIKLLTRMTVLFGSVYENFGGPFLILLGEIAHFLQRNHSQKEMDVYAGCVEVAKSLLEHALQKKKNAETLLKPVFTQLEFFMKERFRKDRTINAAYLMQPFAEIGEFLYQPSFLELSGREELIGELKRILSQFSVLETISERLGETGQTDTSASYHEDLPFMKKRPDSE